MLGKVSGPAGCKHKVRGSDLQQEEGALEVQQADDSCDDDGCQGVKRQMLEHGRQAQQHKAYQCRIHKARRACPNATTIDETISVRNEYLGRSISR